MSNNIWAGANWKDVGDVKAGGGVIGTPGALSPPKPELLSDVAKLGISAVLDENNGYLKPTATKKVVGRDAYDAAGKASGALQTAGRSGGFEAPLISGLSPLVAEEGSQASLLAEQNAGMFGESQADMLNAQMRGMNDYEYTDADRAQLKRDYDYLAKHRANIAASKDYGKTIYTKGPFQFGDVADPRTQVLARNVDNKYTDTTSLQQPSIFEAYGTGLSRIGNKMSGEYDKAKSDASNWLDKHNFWRD